MSVYTIILALKALCVNHKKDFIMSKRQDLWSYLASTDKKIVMYGMGNGADKILEICAHRGIEIADFLTSADKHAYHLLM